MSKNVYLNYKHHSDQNVDESWHLMLEISIFVVCFTKNRKIYARTAIEITKKLSVVNSKLIRKIVWVNPTRFKCRDNEKSEFFALE